MERIQRPPPGALHDRLPDHAKAEMRARREAEERRLAALAERRRATDRRYLVEGVLLFALLEFVFFGLSATRLLVLAVPGIALGWVCARIRAGCAGYAVAAGVAYALVYGALGLLLAWHFVFFVVAAAALGAAHALQRADGSEL